MTVELTLPSGKKAWLLTLDDDRLMIQSEQAFAPGSRVEATGLGKSLRFKVHRSVRGAEGYAIEGRPLDLTRQTRLAFAAALEPGG